MLARAIEGLAGLLLAWATLRDVFYTAVVPGSSRGLLKISRRLVRLALVIWKHTKHRAVGVDFAPLVLVGSFVSWLGLLVLSFGLMLHALRSEFEPGFDGFGHALYVAGGAMATIGFSPVQPRRSAAKPIWRRCCATAATGAPPCSKAMHRILGSCTSAASAPARAGRPRWAP